MTTKSSENVAFKFRLRGARDYVKLDACYCMLFSRPSSTVMVKIEIDDWFISGHANALSHTVCKNAAIACNWDVLVMYTVVWAPAAMVTVANVSLRSSTVKIVEPNAPCSSAISVSQISSRESFHNKHQQLTQPEFDNKREQQLKKT